MKPVLRASEMNQVLLCPASRVLMPLVAERDGGEGFEGTMGHWRVAAKAIEVMKATPPPGGLRAPAVPAGYKFPKNSEWLVEWCLRDLSWSVPPTWAMEVEVPIAYEFDRFILSGHVDLLAIDPIGREILAKDWKLGYSPVDPAYMNEQVLSYIVLLTRAYPDARKITFEVKQPRNDEESGFPRTSSVTVEGKDLESIVAGFEHRVNEALDHSDQLESGMTQCAWCPVGIQCPAIQAEIKQMKMLLTPEALAGIKERADDATLADIIIATRTFKRALEDARAQLDARLDKNKSVTASNGQRITCKFEGGSYKQLDDLEILNALNAVLPPEGVAGAARWSVTRIKDALATTMNIPKSGKAEMTSETIFAARLGHLFEQGTRRKLIFS